LPFWALAIKLDSRLFSLNTHLKCNGAVKHKAKKSGIGAASRESRRRSMKHVFTVLLVSAFIGSVFASGEITQGRAHQIATWYFARYFPRQGCGGAQLPTLLGDYWESTVAIGYAARPSGTILVHRLTGRVLYRGPLLLKPATSADSLERWSKRDELQ
jgi:hypothetical protein